MESIIEGLDKIQVTDNLHLGYRKATIKSGDYEFIMTHFYNITAEPVATESIYMSVQDGNYQGVPEELAKELDLVFEAMRSKITLTENDMNKLAQVQLGNLMKVVRMSVK